MASSKSVDREARATRDRLRHYNARRFAHTAKVRRRLRDNILAIVVAIVVITLATVTQVLYFTSGPGVPVPIATPVQTPDAEGTNLGDIPDPTIAEGRSWNGELALNDVTLGIELDGAAAPQAVAVFVQELQQDYFTGKACHRLTNDGFFVLQCGSLDGAGASDPQFQFGPIENAPADDLYQAGTIAMARGSDNAFSNGRQFFIVYENTTIPSDSAGGYTVIGKVTSGLDQLIEQVTSKGVAPGGVAANDGSPVVTTTITRVTLG